MVIGNLAQLRGNDDKIACFELYRRNIRSPEIVTFDELFYRAKCIVENIGRAAAQEGLLWSVSTVPPEDGSLICI